MEEMLRWRLNAITQFVRRDGSQAGVIWCTSRGGVEFVDEIEGSVRPQDFREACCKDVTAHVGYDCANRAFGGAVLDRRVWESCRR
jgi:hypothetical protein